MLTVVVCVGSSCYVRGSSQVAETFETLIAQEGLRDKIELMGTFCMEQCSMGVSVRVADKIYSGVHPEDAEAFFYDEIVSQLQDAPASVLADA